jgi:hypothetical protein
MRATVSTLTSWVMLSASIMAFSRVRAEDPAAKKPQEAKPAEKSSEEPAAKLNALEKQFQETMTNAVLAGKWRLVQDGKLGEEKTDRYTIRSVAKVGEDLWLIGARVEYGGKDVTVPVPVKVLWAGDTPVITITKAGLPGLGTFTARVLVYDGYYTGTWSGTGHGGFLSGVVERAPAAPGEKASTDKSSNGKPSDPKSSDAKPSDSKSSDGKSTEPAPAK